MRVKECCCLQATGHRARKQVLDLLAEEMLEIRPRPFSVTRMPQDRLTVVGADTKDNTALAKFGLARRSRCLLANSLHRRQQDRHEQADHRDHHQQLNKGKTPAIDEG